MRLLYILSLLFVFSINAKSQCPYKSPYFPLFTDYDEDDDDATTKYSWSAGLYNYGQVGVTGNITSLTFRLDNPSSASETYLHQYIYLRNTTVSSYSSSANYPEISGFTLVWEDKTLTISGSGYYNISLDNSFNYDGSGQLEVLYLDKSGHKTSADLFFDVTEASSNLHNGKYGAAMSSFTDATNDNYHRFKYNTAFGFNTNNSVTCSNFESTLPIVLKTFTAKKENNNVNINWITSTETNNDFFTIEHSLDGVNFRKIEIIKGAGNSNKQKKYTFKDNNPKKGINYYRLKQTDFDGTYTYSKIQAVNFNESENNNVNIYPNPVTGQVLNIETSSENSSINLYNCIGEKIKITITNSSNKHIINVSELPKGIYFIETIVNGDSKYNKVLIK